MFVVFWAYWISFLSFLSFNSCILKFLSFYCIFLFYLNIFSFQTLGSQRYPPLALWRGIKQNSGSSFSRLLSSIIFLLLTGCKFIRCLYFTFLYFSCWSFKVNIVVVIYCLFASRSSSKKLDSKEAGFCYELQCASFGRSVDFF